VFEEVLEDAGADARVLDGAGVLGAVAGDVHHLGEAVLHHVRAVLGGENLLEEARAGELEARLARHAVLHELVEGAAGAQLVA